MNTKFIILFFMPVVIFQVPERNNHSTHSIANNIKIEENFTERSIKFAQDTQWVNVLELDSSIILDIRYATTNNFVEEKMYDCGKCYLRKDVAAAALKIHNQLKKEGLGLKMFDCYRPRPVQWKMWKKVPNPSYVADPRKGSMHNRGSAIDLTIVDSNGKELDMGTDFDFFGQKAYHTYTKHSKEIMANRTKLKSIMEANGFRSIRTEWWHYSYKLKSYPISDWVWNCDTSY